jgi:hypothetical protein
VEGEGMKWEPAKIRFYLLMLAIALVVAGAIMYTFLTPTLEDCMQEQADENLSSACWELLRAQGKI